MAVHLALAFVAMLAHQDPGWRPAGRVHPSPPRSGHVACADSTGRRVWVFGGYAETVEEKARHLPISRAREPTNDLWVFEEENEEGWSCVQPPSDDALRPGPRLCSAAAVLGNELLLFGGWDPRPAGTGGKILADVWALDLSSSTWHQLEDMPRGPTSRHVACVVGQHLLVHTHRCTNALLRWDRSARRLVEQPTTGDAPSARGLHVAAALGNKMLVFGGANQAGEMSSEAFLLDTETWHWSALKGAGAGPSPRAGSACAAAGDGCVVVFGGAERAQDSGGLVPRGDMWLLEAGRAGHPPRWSLLGGDSGKPPAAMPRPRNAATLTQIAPTPDGVPRLLLHGGWEPFVETFDDTFIFEL